LHRRLNDIVFVSYNRKMKIRFQIRMEKRGKHRLFDHFRIWLEQWMMQIWLEQWMVVVLCAFLLFLVYFGLWVLMVYVLLNIYKYISTKKALKSSRLSTLKRWAEGLHLTSGSKRMLGVASASVERALFPLSLWGRAKPSSKLRSTFLSSSSGLHHWSWDLRRSWSVEQWMICLFWRSLVM
jgi:hypothetical protein